MSNKISYKTIFNDVRFWIIFFFVIRLIGITNPPLEVGHNWRQTTVTMVARNFLEVDNNIFYPRIDIAGEKTGITGMEFPILNYIIYLFSTLFGYSHWSGRLINLIFSSFGLWFFYKLVRKYFAEKISLYATLILISSIWFQFSRKVMPDTFAMSLIIAGIYYGSNYLEGKTKRKPWLSLVAYLLLIMMGVLSKLPVAYLLVIFGIYFLNKHILISRKIYFAMASGIALIPSGVWYFYWVPHLVDAYGFWHFFMGKSFSQGFTEIMQNFPETIEKFYETAIKYVGFVMFLFGLVYAALKKDKLVLYIFGSTFLAFWIIIFKAGYTFPHHNYYIIPFVPTMAVIAAYGLDKISYKNAALIFLIAIVIEGIANQNQDFYIKTQVAQIENLEADLDEFSNRNDLVLINSGETPTPMYFAHRKGWVNYNDKIQKPKYIEELKKKGLEYIVILKKEFGTEIKLKEYNKVFDNEDYAIYSL